MGRVRASAYRDDSSYHYDNGGDSANRGSSYHYDNGGNSSANQNLSHSDPSNARSQKRASSHAPPSAPLPAQPSPTPRSGRQSTDSGRHSERDNDRHSERGGAPHAAQPEGGSYGGSYDSYGRQDGPCRRRRQEGGGGSEGLQYVVMSSGEACCRLLGPMLSHVWLTFGNACRRCCSGRGRGGALSPSPEGCGSAEAEGREGPLQQGRFLLKLQPAAGFGQVGRYHSHSHRITLLPLLVPLVLLLLLTIPSVVDMIIPSRLCDQAVLQVEIDHRPDRHYPVCGVATRTLVSTKVGELARPQPPACCLPPLL